jgi:hypothetical protein
VEGAFQGSAEDRASRSVGRSDFNSGADDLARVISGHTQKKPQFATYWKEPPRNFLKFSLRLPTLGAFQSETIEVGHRRMHPSCHTTERAGAGWVGPIRRALSNSGAREAATAPVSRESSAGLRAISRGQDNPPRSVDTVAKLKAARERKRKATGRCEGPRGP